ncbi:hypothetical protein LTR56_021564 [Elasticomyces elasticus]|nr:hypothetical protein LTR56_021564 [Elasticomyces elasticus]KAK3626014.1 hypothetical protein LTR22_023322 [Elasticomyces elasticus]KAK4926756.1 hypothetical protein LTR49_006438 [Elasticomyces elasticus]KAK5741416.1 hypothetical protein LTS12_024615 [Elasticomyces elasticus]
MTSTINIQQEHTDTDSEFQDLRTAYDALHLHPTVFEEFRSLCRHYGSTKRRNPTLEACDEFVVGFLMYYGSRLWPVNLGNRRHLVRDSETLHERRQSTVTETGLSEPPDLDGEATQPWRRVSESYRAMLNEEAVQTTQSRKDARKREHADALLESQLGRAVARYYCAMLRYGRPATKVTNPPDLVVAITNASD